MTTSTPMLETKSSSELNHALDDLLRAFETYKDENDRRLSDIETRGAADPLTTDKLDRLDRALDDHKRRLDEISLKSARPQLSTGGPNTHLAREHRTAFDGYIRKGEAGGLLDIESKALSVGSGPDGGYLVPAETLLPAESIRFFVVDPLWRAALLDGAFSVVPRNMDLIR